METVTTLTPSQAAAVGGAAGAMLSTFAIVGLVVFILYVIASWKIFEKAGEPGWKAIIPIYNVYIMFKIVNMKSWFWWLLVISLIGTIVLTVSIPSYYTMSDAEIAAIDWSQYPAVIVALLVAAVAEIWAGILYAWRTSKVFGHGIGFTIGLLLLPVIFWFILGFGKSKYSKKALKK